MNNFTKEELMHLKACVSCTWLTGYAPSAQICDELHSKLQSLIDNYCEHKEQQFYGDVAVGECNNCHMVIL